jgi:hypothetical protein
MPNMPVACRRLSSPGIEHWDPRSHNWHPIGVYLIMWVLLSHPIHVNITVVIIVVITPEAFQIFHSPSSSPTSFMLDSDLSLHNGHMFRVVRHDFTCNQERVKCICPTLTGRKF